MDMYRLKQIAKIAVPILLVVFVGVYIFLNRASHRAIAGLRPPVQTETTGHKNVTIDDNNVLITFKYEYEIDALVVHTNRHHGFGIADQLSPIDVALAWGDVAEYNDRINFHWSQRGRFVYWKINDGADLALIGDVATVNRQLSNNHLIPANPDIRKQIKRILPGDHIKLKGYLVDIDAFGKDGASFWWYTSTIRSDTGDGSCEIIYVTEVEQLP